MCALVDLTTRLETILRASLYSRIDQLEDLLSKLPPKELQAVFPILITSIFGVDHETSWGLCSNKYQDNSQETNILFDFLSPSGTIFKLCYKLINDHQLKYNFPIRLLPVDVIHILESGRIPQFYLDLINIDSHSRQITSLNLNPFDFYIFHFAIHLYCASYVRKTLDTQSTIYFDLACEYLIHFLPNDINSSVLPNIPYFTGKTPAVSPMQVASRHSHFPSLLINQDISGCSVSNSGNTQFHPRGEVWRSETILQVFIDVWLNNNSQPDIHQIGSIYQPKTTYPAIEHVRIARALIKQCHAFALNGSNDPTSMGELRRAVPGILAPRAHAHIKHLMHTWPLDASFRLVLELWFSYIQPWRYINIKNRRFGSNNQLDNPLEEQNRSIQIDASFIPFIIENLTIYTEIFQLVVPRFLRLNLTVLKNAMMLFRLTKVFSQSKLVTLLTDAENSVANDFDMVTDHHRMFPKNVLNQSCLISSPGNLDKTNGSLDNSFQQTTVYSSTVWNVTDNTDPMYQHQYRPLLLGGRSVSRELLSYAFQAYNESLENIRNKKEQIKIQNSGFFSFIYYSLFGDSSADDIPIDELRKVPLILSSAISQLANIFQLESPLLQSDNSQVNISNGSQSSSQPRSDIDILSSPKLAKERIKHIKYMGDPDKQPIRSYENGFLVKILQQSSCKINELYTGEFKKLYERRDILGCFFREILLPPCTIHTYNKGSPYERKLISKSLSPRITLRCFGSHKFLFWFSLGYILFYILGYGGFLFILFIFLAWFTITFMKSLSKWFFISRN